MGRECSTHGERKSIAVLVKKPALKRPHGRPRIGVRVNVK
jgi:hypothetical protein